MRDRLNLTLRPVDQWLENLNRLEQGLAKQYNQYNLDRELRQTNFEIGNYGDVLQPVQAKSCVIY
jgi:hypothetical protein